MRLFSPPPHLAHIIVVYVLCMTLMNEYMYMYIVAKSDKFPMTTCMSICEAYDICMVWLCINTARSRNYMVI